MKGGTGWKLITLALDPQWQSSILVTCLRLYHVTTLLHCHWWNFWSNTDVKIILWMKSIENRNNKYKSKPKLQLAFSGISSFSDYSCLFAEYDLFKPTTFIQNCIYINFRIDLIQLYINFRDRNIRYDFHGSRSRAKVISFQPIPPFIFPLLSL